MTSRTSRPVRPDVPPTPSPAPTAETGAGPSGTSPRRTDALGYVPALDGLRALAVGAVVVYHLGASWLPGGFLGVDLFFVLSGFLITTLLVQEWGTRGRIDLGVFWTRRIRRLLPLALLVVAAVMLVGWWRTDDSALGPLRSDGLWTVFYGANWHLIGSGQSYFDMFAAPSPLRHAWSLAIEEQFYLVWPLVALGALWLGARLRRRGLGARLRRAPAGHGRRAPSLAVLGTVIVAVAVASAVLMAVRYDADDPSRAYYGTDTRIHELLVGAAAAVLLRFGPVRRGLARVASPLAACALVGVVLGICLIRDEWVGYYRGGAVGFAVAAAVLVAAVVVRERSVPARVFALLPLVWVGRISYGIYLWHWPVYCWIDDAWTPVGHTQLALHVAAKLAGTLALSVTSFYLLERPIRHGRLRVTGRRLSMFAPAAVAAVVGIVLVATASAVTSPAASPRDPAALSEPRPLVAATPQTPLRLATAGDSVTKSLAPGMVRVAHERGWAYTDASVSSCSIAGLLMVDENDEPWKTGEICPDVVPTIQNRLVHDEQPDVVVVHSRWETYPVRGDDGATLAVGTEVHKAYVAEQLRTAMTRLTAGGARVVWIDTLPMTTSLCRRLGHPADVCAHTAVDDTVDTYNALRRQVAASFGGMVTAISLTDVVCRGERCPDEIDGEKLRPDGLHFSAKAAARIVPEILTRAGIGT